MVTTYRLKKGLRQRVRRWFVALYWKHWRMRMWRPVSAGDQWDWKALNIEETG